MIPKVVSARRAAKWYSLMDEGRFGIFMGSAGLTYHAVGPCAARPRRNCPSAAPETFRSGRTTGSPSTMPGQVLGKIPLVPSPQRRHVARHQIDLAAIGRNAYSTPFFVAHPGGMGPSATPWNRARRYVRMAGG